MCVSPDGIDMPCRWCRDKKLVCTMSVKQRPGPKGPETTADGAGVGAGAAGGAGTGEIALKQEEASTGRSSSSAPAVRIIIFQQITAFLPTSNESI